MGEELRTEDKRNSRGQSPRSSTGKKQWIPTVETKIKKEIHHGISYTSPEAQSRSPSSTRPLGCENRREGAIWNIVSSNQFVRKPKTPLIDGHIPSLTPLPCPPPLSLLYSPPLPPPPTPPPRLSGLNEKKRGMSSEYQ